jgi:hypothetical protein
MYSGTARKAAIVPLSLSRSASESAAGWGRQLLVEQGDFGVEGRGSPLPLLLAFLEDQLVRLHVPLADQHLQVVQG